MSDDETFYIDPQMREILQSVWFENHDEPDWNSWREEEVIALRSEGGGEAGPRPAIVPEIPRVSDFLTDGAFGQSRVRLYDPINDSKPLPALIFLHGGGWVGGDIESRDNGARLLAAQSRCAVLSVEYALAPEHRFPEPLDDVVAISRWIHQHANEIGVDANRLAIGGDSAGANLALAAALDLRDTGEQLFKCLLLFYGVYAHDHDTPSHQQFGRDGRYTLSSAAMDCCWRMYLADLEQDKDPRAAPLYADMRDLPPAYVMCGSLDPLLDDSHQLYAKMKQAGIDARKRIFDGVTHSFMSHIGQLDLAVQAWQEAADYLRATLR